MSSSPVAGRVRAIALRVVLLVALAPIGVTALRAGAAVVLPEGTDTGDYIFITGWAPPIYPADALSEKVGGTVRVRFVADEQGRVLSARAVDAADPRLADAAVAAVQRWTIEPPQENYRTVACGLEVKLEFDSADSRSWPGRGSPPPPNVLPYRLPRTKPEPLATPEGDYPEIMQKKRLSGVALFHAVVNEAGRVEQPKILGASHADFVLAAIDSLRRWEFAPAMEGDLPVRSEANGQVSFTARDVTPAEVLVANGITLPDGKAPVGTLEVREACEPVWPLEPLLAGEAGSAVIEFDVLESGAVREAALIEASHPDFGRAAIAAIAGWRFGVAPGVPLERVRLRQRTVFPAVPLYLTDSGDPNRRLVLAMRTREIGAAKGLDDKLAPIYRVRPIYPEALLTTGRPGGRAEIEFIVDRAGRARLPRILSATHPEFGWAAATAVAQWVFKAPTRGGQPVDIKVRIPFDFTAAPP